MAKGVAMPWDERQACDERVSFIVDWQRGEMSVAELCRWYGVSETTGHATIARFKELGWEGLKPRRRAPHHHPNEVPVAIREAVLELRCRHPSWGPKKLRAWLMAHQPEDAWPAQSTIGVLIDRAGLVVRRKRHRHAPPALGPLRPALVANDVWGVDFKGWFRTGDGVRCDPFSLSDLCSRYVLRLQALARPDTAHVWPVFDAAFREFGLPLVVRSDNGAPFASTGLAGLSALAIRLVKAGVTPERIAPGKPQQNGRHERLHRTVKAETATPPAADRRHQQRRFDPFRRVFNEERPHEALGQVTPASVYQPPLRRWSGRLREPEYGAAALVRRVRQNGEIKWRGGLVFLSQTLAGEPVGLIETEDDRWLVSYGPLPLGHLDPAGNFRAMAGACPRHRNNLQPAPEP
jgi:transposase InsO family protein